MTETLFAFDERNYHECQTAFRGDNNQEYYLGDYTIEAGSIIDVRAEKKAVGACSIILLRSKSKLSFRRSINHIREDATDVTVLWFVKRGSLCVTHQSGNSIARAGDFAITKSMSPFTIECKTDDEGVHEVMHVIIPTHIFRRFIPSEINAGFTVAAEGREFLIAERILTDVFEDADELAEHIEQLLVDSALSVLTDAIKDCDNCTQERQSLSERRLQDVLRYIEIHLSDPKLNAAMVAEASGISPRYLSHLLRQHGTSFSTMVWDWRLKTAHQWLSTTKASDISIAEIAFRVGFKSPAHFSRLFKRVYKQGPREYRTSRADEIASPPAPKLQPPKFISSGPSSLQ
ncbi:helix-turn-helix transcriptional regulator [Zhongshania sp.]|uniref:helix-turn-helix transcriptional regulator n=1 Tax=Zhongshania sp. TaxID=1971902 RepID=UPI00356A80E0